MTIHDRLVVSAILFNESGLATPQPAGALAVADLAIAVGMGLASGTLGRCFGYIGVSATSIQNIRASTFAEPPAPGLELVSSSANDTSAGTGSRTVRVTYLRADLSGPYTEDVTMNGTTAVGLADANAQYVEKIETLTVGSNGTNVGTITCRRSGAGSTVGVINAGEGTTYWAQHYVASGRRCFVRSLDGGMQSVNASFFLRCTPIAANAFSKQITASLRVVAAQQPEVTADFKDTLVIEGPALITMHVRPDAATAGTAHGGFSFLDL